MPVWTLSQDKLPLMILGLSKRAMYKLINNEMTLHIQMLQADWMIINYMIEPTYHGLELLSVGLFSCGLAYKL